MNTTITTVLFAASILAASLPSAQAAAPDANERVSVTRTVHLGGLDLSTPAGKRALLARVQVAASAVCHEIVPGRPGQWIDNGICRRDLIAQTLSKVYVQGQISTEQLAATHRNGAISVAGRSP